ncbi:bacteriocin-like protein [Chryseobacterium polytrichastri]|uniref:Uncharacterized protein n=1 Tax=Chryseobacterium polytrichastri TaxID=1302687 RepID=A0A1M6PPZ9_9FLAO|nr:hypothetical protein SAMN05444267_100177 [Chryseobacterium polytrichastri]
MKNFKKISREELKKVNGGADKCGPGFILKCDSFGQCDSSTGLEDCICICIHINTPPL